MKVLAFVVLTGCLALPVWAQSDQSADELRLQCKRAIDETDRPGGGRGYASGYCFATVHTAFVFISWLERDHGTFYDIKIPGDATVSQATRVFLAYTEKHPELLHKNHIEVLLDSWREAWPARSASKPK